MGILILFIPIILGLIVAQLAAERGRSFAGWFVYGILLWPLALVHVAFTSNMSMKCLKCYAKIDNRATRCSSCGYVFTLADMTVINTKKERDEERETKQRVILIIVAIILIGLTKLIFK